MPTTGIQQGEMIRAADIPGLRRKIREKPKEIETQLLAALSPEAIEVYRTALATTWVSQKIESEIYLAAANILLPDHPTPVRELCRQLGHETMSTLFKLFLRIPSVSFVAKQIPFLWRSFYKQGSCEVTDIQPKSVKVIVRNMPGLIPTQREEICGYIMTVLEKTGARDLQITAMDSNPLAWEWHVTWV